MAILPPLAFVLCIVLLSWLLRTGRAHALALDVPNHRSLHTAPTPRIGGLGIIPGALAAMIGVGEFTLALLTTGLALVSWLDDRREVSIPIRIGIQFVAAGVWIACFTLTLWSVVAVVALVWMANLYNFMDGSDGLAGGMAVFGFGAYAAAAWLGGNPALAWLALAIAAAALGFLRFNFPPARLFMGDGGSVPLGFAAGALGYQGWSMALWPGWFPLLVFSPFVMDATLTLLRRGWRGERVAQAHRDHYYQRLVRMGWSHRQTALVEYGLMLLAATSALAMTALPIIAHWIGLSCWAGIYILLGWRIDRAWRTAEQA